MRPVVCVFMFLTLFPVGAKAPVWEDSAQKRKPAQSGLTLPSIDHYLDLNCSDLTNSKSEDEFIRYFSREAKLNYDDLCSLVKEDQEIDSDISQSERESIGLGTFSRLVEGHFDEFIMKKKLYYYQDLDCRSLMNTKSDDKFIAFLSKKLKEDGGDLCQAEIGLGTKSKVVEVYFDAFIYHYRQ